MRRQTDAEGNRSQLYQDRMQKFYSKIRAFQNQELKKIQEKSNDEIQYETNKIVSENRNYENDAFSKKNKSLQVQSKIRKSRKINESRLSKMKIRFEMIEGVQTQVKKKFSEVINNQQQYAQLLEGLIIQGLIKLLEQKVEVKCLQRDVQVVQSVLPNCERRFAQMCDIKTQLVISHQRLPQSEIGGIILTSFFGKIVCSNTLKARLDYAVQQALPDVRKALFTTQLQGNAPNVQNKAGQQVSAAQPFNHQDFIRPNGPPLQPTQPTMNKA